MKAKETASRDPWSNLHVVSKDKADKIVKYVLDRHLTCEHNSLYDCRRCMARWIREALKKHG